MPRLRNPAPGPVRDTATAGPAAYTMGGGGHDDDDVSLSLVPSGRPYVLAPRA